MPRKPDSTLLFIIGLGCFMAGLMLMTTTDQMRPVRSPSGEIMLHPDGTLVLQHDTFAQLKQDWVPDSLLTIGLICWGWMLFRAIIYVIGRRRSKKSN